MPSLHAMKNTSYSNRQATSDPGSDSGRDRLMANDRREFKPQHVSHKNAKNVETLARMDAHFGGVCDGYLAVLRRSFPDMDLSRPLKKGWREAIVWSKRDIVWETPRAKRVVADEPTQWDRIEGAIARVESLIQEYVEEAEKMKPLFVEQVVESFVKRDEAAKDRVAKAENEAVLSSLGNDLLKQDMKEILAIIEKGGSVEDVKSFVETVFKNT